MGCAGRKVRRDLCGLLEIEAEKKWGVQQGEEVYLKICSWPICFPAVMTFGFPNFYESFL